MECIILVGGLGTRLKEIVGNIPKPMATVSGSPFLTYILNHLLQQGFMKAILSVGYNYQYIEEYYGNKFGELDLIYAVEKEPLGTGGAIINSLKYSTMQSITVINGDTLFKINYKELIDYHKTHQADLTIALKKVTNSSRYGSVKLKNHRIVGFDEKQNKGEGLISGGVYNFHSDLFNNLMLPEKFSIEIDFFDKYIGLLNIVGYEADAFLLDIGTPEDYYRAQTELTEIL